MKKVLLMIAISGTIFLGSCQKDEVLVPAENSSVKVDKGVSCRGCGQWDIATTGAKAALNTVTYDGETDKLTTQIELSTSNSKR
ncbi:MAG: hypothetical protein WBJ10_01180 [Daejeonella sp.]|uniref:hypothetical protein n=1 Tax=Daejeonella sp. TaxID=2805397 RepID=UPI003C76CF74